MEKKYPQINLKRCKSCCACSDVCPTTSIVMQQKKANDKRLYPTLIQENCILCKKCLAECPINAISLD